MMKDCSSCLNWRKIMGQADDLGECRQAPPRIVAKALRKVADCADWPEINGATLFPVTHEEDWCGAWIAKDAADAPIAFKEAKHNLLVAAIAERRAVEIAEPGHLPIVVELQIAD